mgnify:CR=1 FL=1
MSTILSSRCATRLRKRAVLLLTSAAIAGSATGAAHAEGDTLRLLTYNIWHRLKQEPEAAAQVLIPGNYDAILFQEENNSTFVRDLPGILEGAGLGAYQGARIGDSGIISRVPGTMGAVRLPGAGGQGHNISYTTADAAEGRPATTVGSVHFDWADTSTKRIAEANALADWATTVQGPVIMGGDFNAGDVAERGLHDIDAQIRLLQNGGGNNFYHDLSWQYIANGDEAQLRRTVQEAFPAQNIDSLSWRQWGDALKAAHAEGKDVGLRDETLPVASNTPVTMNILKKDFVMFHTDAIREKFAPHELGDGSTTWPSFGEDATNTWPSWDRSKIDHFLVSRPYAKWYELTDDPSDDYLGVVDKQYVDRADGTRIPLSDHELVAHEFTWTGPRLEPTDEGSRLVWDNDASAFEARDGVLELTRNNMRTDVYLGQVADENGNPTLSWLTDAQKKTLLDCGSGDARLAGAIADYCIDDHSFISETLVSDGGTVAVTEDAALGGADADLRLADGSLRVDGTEMDTLNREVSLEGKGGTFDIVDAAAEVTLAKAVSGTGSLSKQGDGTLRLDAQNTYTGNTTVEAGTMLVNGSIASSALTLVLEGASLGGNGHVGNLVLSENGTLLPGDLGIGSLHVDGDLKLGGSLLDLEIGKDGFDSIHVAGNFTALSDYKISFSFLDSFLPETGDFFEFLTVGGAFDTVLEFADLLLPLDGRYQGLGIFGNESGSFALAWNAPYAVAAVPLPLPAVMLLSALGLIGGLRRRRRA